MSRTETPGSRGTTGRMEDPQAQAEATRKSMSLFARSEDLNEHKEQLEANAHMIGGSLTVTSVCVFSASRKAGNPVAVVLDPEVEYSVAVMGKIAERCVEPFVVVVQPGKKSSRYSLRISVLTPGGGASVTMAESMVIAAVQVLVEQQPDGFPEVLEGKSLEVTVCSPIGDPLPWDKPISIRVLDDGSIWVKMPTPKVISAVNPQDVSDALNIPMLALQTDLPVQVVGCVGRHILVPLRSRMSMVLDPSFDAISEVCRKYDAEGFHLFSLDAMAGGAVHTRNLSPLARSEEEPASPSANAGLIAYMHYHRILPIDSEEQLDCEQGFTIAMMPRPSKVSVRLVLGPAAVERASVSATEGGLTAQNHWAGGATGEAATRDKWLLKGDHVTSNWEDNSRFNLREGYYEEQRVNAMGRSQRMEAAKRAGKVYKEEEKAFSSDAILPPALAQPAEVKECWVGGVAVLATRPEYPVDY
ncbi:hypothetical protein T484DRAFT_1934633 [Baffinella frigidus]|nr:hypothetical protein T484DRAFT_1934633 [Cryptophyta sp. CCMP2293]